jgi:hypothetical protein
MLDQERGCVVSFFNGLNHLGAASMGLSADQKSREASG